MSENGNNQDVGQSDQDGSPRVGSLLRASRTRIGEDLREVSEILRIRYLYLEAIEACRYEDLPGETYAVGFIRSYAEHLGLDGEEVVRRFRAEQAGSEQSNQLAFPTPVPESGIPKGAIVLVGVILALLVYGGWYATTTDEDFFADLISPVPDRLKHLVEGENEPAQPVETPTASTIESSAAAPTDPTDAISDAPPASDAPVSEIAVAPEPMMAPEVDTPTPVASDVAEAPAPDVDPTSSEPATPLIEQAADPEPAESTDAVSQSVGNAATEDVASVAADPATDEAQTISPSESAAEPEEPLSTGNDAADSNNSSQSVESEPAVEPTVDALPTEELATSTESTPSEQAIDVVEESVTPEASPPADAVQQTEEVTADELNAAALRAATSQSEVATPTPLTETSPATVEVAEIPGSEVLNTTGDVSDTGIVIRATNNSWVEITDANTQSVLFTGVMSAGTSFDVPSRDGLLLTTGNAGVLDIFVDGESVPKIGGIGAVRKGVTLNPDRLKAGTASDR